MGLHKFLQAILYAARSFRLPRRAHNTCGEGNGRSNSHRIYTEPKPGATGRSLRGIPHGIWALGFVSMFMDISSEMIHSLLPIFLISVLGATATSIGILEGVSEAAVLVTKMFSGALSDWLGKRKALVVTGYSIAAFTKPLFRSLAPTPLCLPRG